MDKYVYSHEKGTYQAETSLSGRGSNVFEALRECTEPGVFVYAPTTAGKAILFSYTHAGGQSRVDAYKGDFEEYNPNPASYVGAVRVSPPYYEKVVGPIPCGSFSVSTSLEADVLAYLAKSVVLGNGGKPIVLNGTDITRRSAEYLGALFSLFPKAYALKLGFCINKYIQRTLDSEEKFPTGEEKPIIKIYALDSNNEFSGCDKINLEGSVPPIGSADMAAKALRHLIRRGVNAENLDAIYLATESAFAEDGSLNLEKYKACLIRAAYADSHSTEFAWQTVKLGFSTEAERTLFEEAVNVCLQSGSDEQKRDAVGKAMELLQGGASVEGLLDYLCSKATLAGKEYEYLLGTIKRELEGADCGAIGDGDLFSKYLNGEAPSWQQKYAVAVEVVSHFIKRDEAKAEKLCTIISERFKEERLVYNEEGFGADMLFTLGGRDKDVKIAIYAALLKTDCGKRKHNYARTYLNKQPVSLAEIFEISYKIRGIFALEASQCDFIRGDAECERVVEALINKIEFSSLLGQYEAFAGRLSDSPSLKALFLAKMLNKTEITKDAGRIREYTPFLAEAEAEISEISGYIGAEQAERLEEARRQCLDSIEDVGSSLRAQGAIDEYIDGFRTRLCDVLSPDSGKSKKPEEKKSVIDKFNKTGRKMKLGSLGFSYALLYGVLAAFIVCAITFIPAACLSIAVGNASFLTYLSRYFYVTIAAPVFTAALYTALYLFVFGHNERSAFRITSLVAYVPTFLLCMGYVLGYLLFT